MNLGRGYTAKSFTFQASSSSQGRTQPSIDSRVGSRLLPCECLVIKKVPTLSVAKRSEKDGSDIIQAGSETDGQLPAAFFSSFSANFNGLTWVSGCYKIGPDL
jgi:hypothetical protein